MTEKKLNRYELDVISRYLPHIEFDHGKINSGDFSSYECINSWNNFDFDSKDIDYQLSKLRSSSLLDIEIVSKAILQMPAYEASKISQPIYILNELIGRENADINLIQDVFNHIHDGERKSFRKLGVFRDMIIMGFDKMNKDTIKRISEYSDKLSHEFKNIYGLDTLSTQLVHPIADGIRLDYKDYDLDMKITNNQFLVGIIRRSFPNGIKEVCYSDSSMSIDDIFAELEGNDTGKAVDPLPFKREDFSVEGKYGKALDDLCVDIKNLKDQKLTIRSFESDSMLISDLLMILSKTIRAEKDDRRKNLLEEGVNALLDVCPVRSYADDIKSNESMYEMSLRTSYRNLSSNPEVLHYLSSSSAFTESGQDRTDRRISNYFYKILLNIAFLDRYQEGKKNTTEKKIGFSPLSICGGSLIERSIEDLAKPGSLSSIGKDAGMALINEAKDMRTKRLILKANPELKKSSLEMDFGL